ncbi:Alpha/Beta hydrolase protein [Cladochytrium replicatum]|nr:Alpha/Beta hydrolase protein [Cladochytrium replicatum]
MKMPALSGVLVVLSIASLSPSNAAVLPKQRYVSPSVPLVQKWVETAPITEASKAYALDLLELDSRIETIYKGDGKVQPTVAYSPFVDIRTKNLANAEAAAASGSATANASDVVLMKSWAQISTISHCEPSAIVAWNCTTCKSSLFPQPVSILTADQNDIRFYAGYIPSLNQIFVSFRGSTNAANYFSNFNFGLTNFWITGKAPSGSQFHSGFQKAYSDISGTVRTFVSTLAATYPTAELTLTGHSLGGALATHAALDLLITKYVPQLADASKIRLFSQGEPRMANPAGSAWISKQGWAGSYRLVNYDDIVPHLPPSWFNFRHHTREYWVLKDGSTVATCDDVTTSDNEDTNCLNTIAFTSSTAHNLYLGVPMGSGC